MSTVQKKRKSRRTSNNNNNNNSSSSSSSSNQPEETQDVDSEDEKFHKKKTGTNSENDRGVLTRVCIVFVTLVLLVFYDVTKVNQAIYSHVFYVSSKSIVHDAARHSKSKHRGSGVDVIIDETKNIELQLVRSGATVAYKPAYETERIRRILSGSEEGDSEDNKPEEGKDQNTEPLFKDKQQVLDFNEEAELNIKKRTGKATFIVRKEGYDLGGAGLRGDQKIHDGHKLEDFVELSKARAEANREDRENERKGKKGSGKPTNLEGKNKGDKTTKTDKPKAAAQEEFLDRKMVFETRKPDQAFEKFVAELRTDNTYAHLGKKNDMERGLKSLGYKQSTKSSRKQPMWIGYEDKGKCPAFRKDEDTKISFCPYYIPQNKADQFAYLKSYVDKVPKSKLKPDFYPLTWRLYKEQERRALKLHCTNESMSEFGEAYVRKFTVPGSNYMKSAESIYDQLVKSDKKVKELTKETKNRAIVQLYINNPLLIEERKFIIRTFAVIVSGKPFIVYYSDGAVFRSIVKYKPFTMHDSGYKKAAHITSEQKSAQKKVLKSSELYTSFASLQQYLSQISGGKDDNYVNNVLRPQMKARMIYSLYAILKRQRSSDDHDAGESVASSSASLPSNAAVVQTSCFDFLMDETKKLWLITVATGQHCFVNMGGSSFKPGWKVKLQEALSDNTAKLAEEVLWRRMNKKPISSMKFYTQTGMTVLIDETFPDWDVTKEINAHVDGIQVPQDNTDYSSFQDDSDQADSIIGMKDGQKKFQSALPSGEGSSKVEEPVSNDNGGGEEEEAADSADEDED